MHQQAAGAARLFIKNIALLIGADMHPQYGHLSVLDDAERVLQVDIAQTDGFDFGARKFDAGLVFFLDKIVVVGLAVLRHDLDRLCHRAPPFLQGGHHTIFAGKNQGERRPSAPPACFSRFRSRSQPRHKEYLLPFFLLFCYDDTVVFCGNGSISRGAFLHRYRHTGQREAFV